MGVITSKETITPDKNDSVSNHGKTVSDHFGSRDDDESSDESSYHSFEEDNMSCYAENIGLKDNSTGENGEDTSTDGAVPDLRERGSISDDDMSINRDGLDLDNDDGNLSISDGDQLWPCGDNDAIRSSGNDSIVVINKDEKLATNETHPPPTQLLVTPTRDYVFCIDGYRHETILFREDRSLPEKQRRSSGEILKALANQIHTGAKSCVCIATGCECAFGLVSSLISHLHTKHAIKLVATDG
ncbi:hypothetical protein DFQ28_007547 [Apophysomyces sp. BC1034]|nr:hypothetical protein DFQ30_008726 [Apophysomyces sp. BC1015]KAG0177420.1 hypothetical protein DFQ29_004834 [Apophysomyces sp. BC1021]KAG0186610.1 hypothetical protein DFQ28_007547 [Apophysomyces sp. BC1034]